MIRNKVCELCPKLSEHANRVCLMAKPRKADIMVLGETPTMDEDAFETLFSGKSNRFFKKNILKPLNIDPEKVFFDYAVKCNTPKGRKPSRNEVLHCRGYLEQVIADVQPKLILVSGNPGLCSLLYLDMVGGINSWRGKLVWSREFNCWIMPIHSFWKVSRDKNMGLWTEFDRMLEDVKRGLEAIANPPKLQKLPKWKLLKTVESISGYLKRAYKADTVAVDLETHRFDPRNEILGVSLTYKKERTYYPVYIEWKWFEEYPELATLLDKILQSKKIVKILHNIDFDQKFLYWHKYPLAGKLHDTMMMARLLDETFSMGLKERTWTVLDFGGYDRPLEEYKFEHKFTKKSSYNTIPIDVMSPYAAYDTLATYQLFEKFTVMLKKEGLWPLYEKIVMPVRLVMTEASINGLYCDMDQVAKLDLKMDKVQAFLKEQIHVIAGHEFNFNSPQQLGTLLFDTWKAPNGGKNKNDKWKCDKAVLGVLADMKGNRKYSKLARLVLKYKYIHKAQGTYTGQAKKSVWEDGRVRSRYNPAGTVTGRTTNTDPCNHNIPKDRLIRSLYRASPGNVLVEGDIKAAEMRAIALESGDETLLEIFRRGEDIHNQTYNEMFRKPRSYIPTEKERRIAKSINFGLIYGITAVGLSRRLGISVDEGQRYIDMYFKRFDGVAKWIRATIDFTRKHGYVVSKFGRRRRLHEINNDDKFIRYRAERQAMNAPIQGEAADYTYIGLIRVSKLLKRYQLEAKIVHTVHDCIIVDTPKNEVKKVKGIIKVAFLTPVKAFPIKMEIDIEVGELWGQHNESNLEVILNEILNMKGVAA